LYCRVRLLSTDVSEVVFTTYPLPENT
jgi:hypothetical protein